MNFLNPWTSVVSSQRNEIVFENRNRNYGAFIIRREYSRTVWISMLYTGTIVLLIVLTPKIIGLFSQTIHEKIVSLTSEQVVVDVLPDISVEPPVVPKTQPHVTATTAAPTTPEVRDVVETSTSPITQTTDPGTIGPDTHPGDPEPRVPETNIPATVVVENNDPVDFADTMPQFPGGDAMMHAFLKNNMSYPPIESENGIQGTVFLSFVVDKTGSINDLKVLRGVKGGPGLELAAVKAVERMPKWKPGNHNGRKVAVHLTLPVRFVLKN